MTNPLQKYEWMLRIPLTQMQQGITYLGRVRQKAGGLDDTQDLIRAEEAMALAIGLIQRWCKDVGIDLPESMKT